MQRQTFTVGALCKVNGIDVVRAVVHGGGEPMIRLFPAHKVVDHLVYDEEIELKQVAFG